MILFRWKKNIYSKCIEDKCKGGKITKGKYNCPKIKKEEKGECKQIV